MSFRALFITTAVGGRFLSHTYFLDKIRKFRATYGFDGKEKPVSNEVQQRVMQVMDDLKVPEDVRNKIKIFSVHNTQLFYAGTTRTNYGAIIGIPPNFNYKNADNLNINRIQIRNARIPWTEETLRQFSESLLLSDNAQKFVIALAILHVQKYDIIVKSLVTALDLTVAFSLYDMFHSLLKFENKSKLYNLIFKVFAVIISFVIWQITERLVNNDTYDEIVEQLIALGPEYVQGGKEYFEKLCQLEDVLADRLKKKSQNKVISSIFKLNVPLSEQKEVFTLKLQEMSAV